MCDLARQTYQALRRAQRTKVWVYVGPIFNTCIEEITHLVEIDQWGVTVFRGINDYCGQDFVSSPSYMPRYPESTDARRCVTRAVRLYRRLERAYFQETLYQPEPIENRHCHPADRNSLYPATKWPVGTAPTYDPPETLGMIFMAAAADTMAPFAGAEEDPHDA